MNFKKIIGSIKDIPGMGKKFFKSAGGKSLNSAGAGISAMSKYANLKNRMIAGGVVGGYAGYRNDNDQYTGGMKGAVFGALSRRDWMR